MLHMRLGFTSKKITIYQNGSKYSRSFTIQFTTHSIGYWKHRHLQINAQLSHWLLQRINAASMLCSELDVAVDGYTQRISSLQRTKYDQRSSQRLAGNWTCCSVEERALQIHEQCSKIYYYGDAFNTYSHKIVKCQQYVVINAGSNRQIYYAVSTSIIYTAVSKMGNIPRF